jgi:coenzyme PQQ precursor peptide PqqA
MAALTRGHHSLPLNRPLMEVSMRWTKPKFEDIPVGCEINGYASAEF